jgi:hypothetical protein
MGRHWACGHETGRAKLVIDGRLVCPDCQYEAEYGLSERKPPQAPPQTMAVPVQEERLFPLPPPVRKPRGG